ncbi:hypothetical protein [Sphingobacterium yanglingense]|uniref:Uncharacterized protein n=1 Tax=Sphingobacterium yanglingense TaxID=1437280 RepID=A0A4V6PXG5_9SPHI|nr:hypothetical protein [Sphingobacterium yanglingense]TDQ79529.1 hypothetical protein CLV99_0971 [Sphingobacterium yanglingense]
MNSLLVTPVNNENSIPKALGISNERQEELQGIISNEFKQKKPVTAIMSSLSNIVLNANELAFVNFKIGTVIAELKNAASNPMALLAAVMGGRG